MLKTSNLNLETKKVEGPEIEKRIKFTMTYTSVVGHVTNCILNRLGQAICIDNTNFFLIYFLGWSTKVHLVTNRQKSDILNYLEIFLKMVQNSKPTRNYLVKPNS